MLFLPQLLSSILVVISFHWDRFKFTLLRLTLLELVEYRLHSPIVDIVVVTDKPEALERLLYEMRLDDIIIHPFNSSSPQFSGKDKFDLLWEHRIVMKERFDSPRNYSTFMYLEDDTLVPWPTLVSWAIDTEVLEPLGFTRGIFRTEFNNNGNLSLNDLVTDLANFLGCSMNITKDDSNPSPHFVNTLHLTDHSETSKSLLLSSQKKHEYARCLPPAHSVTFRNQKRHHQRNTAHNRAYNHSHVGDHNGVQVFPCPVHSHFVNFYSPFQGMWVFSRTQLENIMKDSLWDRGSSFRIDTRRNGQRNWNWGSPERSNSILYFANRPQGFHTSNVVPFNFHDEVSRKGPKLSLYAQVEHTRHAYDIICTYEEALVT